MRLHSTSAGATQPFAPADGKTVRMYVCGPTVYADAHLGHARSAVVYDTLRRVFAAQGWRVRHVMNVTDMAEEIAHRASIEKATIRATAAKYAKRYLQDMRRLGVQPPSKVTWASDFIPAMVDDIEALLAKGAAYEQDGSVYFDTRAGAPLGLVSRARFADITAGDPPPRTARRDPADFLLWRNSHDWGECWFARWSCGRPGWHNQCTAMAQRTLGPTVDVHGGGVDLAFPHHDSEAAVAQALTGQPLARFWVHHGHVTVWKEKMSKSRGNFVPARDAVRKHGAAAVRLFLLSAPYRATLDYDPRAMRRWAALAQGHRRALAAARRRGGRARPAGWDDWRKAFDAALADDLDTPRALALLEDAVARAPKAGTPPEAAGAARSLAHAGRLLGLDDAARR